MSEPVLNLYKLTQNVNNDYDTYDSCIVCASNEIEAINIRPDFEEWGEKEYNGCWVYNKKDVNCIKIGIADKGVERGVILSSFNAG